jgi:serine/threonine-protein kinase HipA
LLTFAYFKYGIVYMALHLVGETIDKARSHHGAETGQLVQLMRGIYVDRGDDIDTIVLIHAVRIANYLYPRAYLSAASSSLIGPTRDGRLFLSARRKQRTRIRALEIIQNEAPEHPSIGQAIVDDGMGEFQMKVSSMRQRFLEAFRMRSEHAASIDESMRETIATRLVEEYGTPEEAAAAVWALAKENKWLREGDAAERYMLHRPVLTKMPNKAAFELTVAWHAAPIGRLTHDGYEWRWYPLEDAGPALIRQTTPGQLPPFIVSLLPEGWLEDILADKDERATLRRGKRYMSNITITEDPNELSELPSDVLMTRLQDWSRNGAFIGHYAGPARKTLEESFERNLARIFEAPDTPRISGVQIKAPMNLAADGTLAPSTGKPFSHILKPAGTSGYDNLPIIEWLDMELGRAAGFVVPTTALIAMPDGMPPALIVERFDVRKGADDKSMIALEDLCSVLGLPPKDKYSGTIERIARALRPVSTSPEEDLLTVFQRALFAWLVGDGDMHLKNLALLKIAGPGERHFRSIRMAPLYDAVTTRVFPKLRNDHMALKLNGKDDRLRRNDFRDLARTIGLRTGDAETLMDKMLNRLASGATQVQLPEGIEYSVEAEKMAREVLELCRSRVQSFA